MLLDGIWAVCGPGFFKSLLWSRLCANVARSITESLPRLDPYELKSLGDTLCTWQSRRITELQCLWNSLTVLAAIFPGESGLANFIELRMMEVVVTIGAVSHAKLQSNCHYQQTNTQLFTGRMPFLSPNQQCQSTVGEKVSHSMDSLTPCSPGVFHPCLWPLICKWKCKFI